MYPEGRSASVVAALVILFGSVGLTAAGLAALGTTPAAFGTTEATPVAASASPHASAPEPTPSASPTATSRPTQPSTPPSTATPAPSPTPPPEVQHVVAPGDVLERIANEYGIPLAAIAERNGIPPPYSLEVGQVLLIPVPE